MPKQKLLVVLGPTASGKSDLAVDIALAFNGEVVSSDSRQIYKNMNIGTAKITPEEMKGVPHHMIDIVEPKETYSVAEYKEAADAIISDIHIRGRLPILCGGTGFYIQSIVDDIVVPEVSPDEELRLALSRKGTLELLEILRELDPERAESVEQENPRRLIRAIEIATHLGKVPSLSSKPNDRYEILQIGLRTDNERLRSRIDTRVDAWLEGELLNEVKTLHESGVSWDRLYEHGLEYRFPALFLQGEIDREEMIKRMKIDTWRYAKRQRTWFKRDSRIQWFKLDQKEEILKAVTQFIYME